MNQRSTQLHFNDTSKCKKQRLDFGQRWQLAKLHRISLAATRKMLRDKRYCGRLQSKLNVTCHMIIRLRLE